MVLRHAERRLLSWGVGVAARENISLFALRDISETAFSFPLLFTNGEPRRLRYASSEELVGEVLSIMRGLAEEGRTMLVVTHEMGFAREVSDQVMFLHQGQIEEYGPPDQVFESPKSERFKQFLSGTLN